MIQKEKKINKDIGTEHSEGHVLREPSTLEAQFLVDVLKHIKICKSYSTFRFYRKLKSPISKVVKELSPQVLCHKK